MDEVPLYVASPWQQAFHDLTVDEALGAGAAGPGKSMGLLMDPIRRIKIEHDRCLDTEHPYFHPWGTSEGWALHLRRTRPMLEQTIARARKIFPMLDTGAKWDQEHTTWTFSSGYRYALGHCRNNSDTGIYLSNQYDWIGFDELSQFNQSQYDEIILRNRSSDVILRTMLFVRSMSNPVIHQELSDNFTVDDPGWVKRMFVDPAPDGKTILRRTVTMPDGRQLHKTLLYLRAQLYDNPDKQFVADYERKLALSKPHLRDAYLYGRWDVTVGSHFGDEFQHRLHVCQPFRVPSDWPVFRSMDWGYKKPGCVHYWSMDEDGNLFCIHELTFRMNTPYDVAKMMEKYEKEFGWWKGKRSLLTGPADTQLWEDRGDVMTATKAGEFAEMGVGWTKADKRSRFRNAELLMERLKDHDNGTATPGIVFFNTCTNLIRTLPAIPSDKNYPEQPADGGEDHWVDSAMYASAYASHGRKGLHGIKRIDDWDNTDDEAPKATDSWWRWGRWKQ